MNNLNTYKEVTALEVWLISITLLVLALIVAVKSI